MSNRRTSKRLLTRTLIIALLLAVVLVAVAPAAFASAPPPCNKGTCNGEDPRLTGCNVNATTIHTVYNGSQKVDLRYSPWCHAYWSRVTNQRPERVLSTDAWIKANPMATIVTEKEGYSAISNMWWKSPHPRACGNSVKNSGLTTPTLCTPRP